MALFSSILLALQTVIANQNIKMIKQIFVNFAILQFLKIF